MNRMIRNVDPAAYKMLKTAAAAEGRTIGEVLTDAIVGYVARPVGKRTSRKRKGFLANLPVIDFGPGSENWSENSDEAIYGGDP